MNEYIFVDTTFRFSVNLKTAIEAKSFAQTMLRVDINPSIVTWTGIGT